MVLEKAKELAEAINISKEYTEYKALKDKLFANDELAGKLFLFEAKQSNLQRMQMLGEELNKDELNDAQELFDELNQIAEVKEYFDAQADLNKMMADVSRILASAMEL